MTVIFLLCLAAGSDGQGSLCPYIKQESPEKHLVFTFIFFWFVLLHFCFVLPLGEKRWEENQCVPIEFEVLSRY